MLNEDQYLERTPDLVAKIRKLREEAEKKMNRFARTTDYDVRYVQGHGPKPVPVAEKPATPAPDHSESSVTGTPATFLPAPARDEEHPG